MGLDLSLTGTGIATHDATGWHTEVVETRPRAGDRVSVGTKARMDTIRQAIGRHLDKWDPDLVVIEQPIWGGRTASAKAADRAGLWWLVFEDLTVRPRGSIFPRVAAVVNTSRARYATGKGNASKMACMAAAVKRYPTADIVDDNAADAVILAAMGKRWLGEPVEPSLPKVNLDGLARVDWPL